MRLENIVITVLAAAAALQLGACGVGQASVTTADQQEPATPLPVEVSSPVKADVFATYRTTATITPDSEAAVLARVEGEVIEILVEEGDQVVEGQILARLDGDRLRLRQIQAKANLDKVSREYERFVRLHEKGLVSASAIDGLRYDMDALEAAYKLQRLDYEYTTIRAPISGVVSARDIKLGQHVDVNDTTFRITDTSELVAYLRIPQTELNKFSAGHLAKVRVDAMPGQAFDALIARISPTIDMRNGTFRATAYIDNENGLLAPGMFGRFDIAYEQHVDALMIPLAALVTEDNQTVVYVVEDGAASRRIIQTGIQSGEDIEVLGGLEEHEQIVVTGQGSLRDGSRVLASIEITGPVTG
jgi:membrane fusion protein (multidrug efflux system)